MVVAAIVAMVIAAVGVVNYMISKHYAEESARAMLKFNSESIRSGIDNLMMSRDNDGVLRLIRDISARSSMYRDIRLVSHHTGETVVSRLDSAGTVLTKDAHFCAACHRVGEPVPADTSSLDEVVAGSNGARFLQVITPIANEPGCRTADCHAHEDSGPLLGFLQAEYSLGEVDTLILGLNASFVMAALIAVALGMLALWLMVARTLGRPIREMIKGIRAVADNNLSFRFPVDRADEFGLLGKSFNDMAARIQAHQRELHEAMEYLEGIVENSADIIITVNPRGLIQTVNRGAETVLGYGRDELVGERIEVLFADPRERDVAIARLRDQDNVTNFETRFLTKNGEMRNVLLTLSRLRDRDGNPVGTFGISKDITREKNLQERLFQSEKDAAIGQAVTTIQHAIKNLLNTLTGGAYLARNGMSKSQPARMEDGLAMIDDGIARIRDLATNMLRYAREWKLELENADLGQIVRDVCTSIAHSAEEKGITVVHDIAGDVPMVHCDRRLMHMALMDMATNAIDACWQKAYDGNETARIVFRNRMEGADEIVIEVEDNGVGMNAETKERLFTPFFSTKESWGTGLGLASTSRIISMHGGEIVVESEPNRGARFRVTLPLWSIGANQGA